MSDLTNLDTLTPEQESLVLDAIEGQLRPERRPEFERLLDGCPGLEQDIARLTESRNLVAALASVNEPEVDFAAPVLERVESLAVEPETPVLHLQHMDPPARPRLQISSTRVRTLAAAAAVLIIAALSFSFLKSGPVKPKTNPGPDIAAAPDGIAPDALDPSGKAPAPELAQAERELRSVELAQTHWTQTRNAEPTLAEAAALLSSGRLVIRTLAPSRDIARAGVDALKTGLDAQSTAWEIVSPSARAIAARFDQPEDTAPIMAMDEQTGLRLEIPRARLIDVWTARVEPDASAIASLVHSLRELGFTVRLEALPEPVELDDPLENALWWDQSPATWQPIESAPIVIETLDR